MTTPAPPPETGSDAASPTPPDRLDARCAGLTSPPALRLGPSPEGPAARPGTEDAPLRPWPGSEEAAGRGHPPDGATPPEAGDVVPDSGPSCGASPERSVRREAEGGDPVPRGRTSHESSLEGSVRLDVECAELERARKQEAARQRNLLLVRARRVTRAVPEAVVCRAAAAQVWGLEVLRPAGTAPALELITPGGVEIPGCVTRTATLSDDDVTYQDGIRVTTPARTAFDCAHGMPRAEAVVVLDQLLRRGVDLDALWLRTGSGAARAALGLADARAASPRESWLRVMLVGCGLPRPTPQIRVLLPGGRQAYLDLGWEAYKVAVEYDGRRHHATAADRRHDGRRRDELRRYGWRIIVAGPDVIPARAADLLEAVAGALVERGWRPGPAGMIRILSRIRAARRPRISRRHRSYG